MKNEYVAQIINQGETHTFIPYLDSFDRFLVRVTVIGGELFPFISSSGVIIAPKNVTLVSKKKSILVEVFDFVVTQVVNFCKSELITVTFKLIDGKDASLVLFKPER